MLPSDPAALDSLLDRALGADTPAVPFPPRPPETAPHPPRRRLGRAAAGAVVVVLGVGLAVTTQLDSGPPPAPAAATPTTTPPRPRPTTTTTVVVETRDGVEVELREPADLEAAYRAVAPDDGVAAVGPSTCANGAAEERAWSSPGAPEQAAGRYRCRFESGRAAIWWTVEDAGVLAHATAANDDLAALFAWWLAQTDV